MWPAAAVALASMEFSKLSTDSLHGLAVYLPAAESSSRTEEQGARREHPVCTALHDA